MARFRVDNDDGNEPVTLGDGTVTHETEKAVQVRIDDKTLWVPKSVLHADSEAFSLKNADGKIIVKRWWAEKNGHA